ncbi:MAG: DUF1311 domain-containing protein [Verrucomicrobia bacterium]|nr:DUF1311 domain-containing protein [Verrucomicrobiota bacterium]
MKNKLTLGILAAALAAEVIVAIPTPAAAQSEATILADVEYKKADKELNEIYQKIIKRVQPSSKQDLIESQRAWLTFRNLDAKVRAGISSQGGSSYSTDYIAILTDLTNQRIASLKSMLIAL